MSNQFLSILQLDDLNLWRHFNKEFVMWYVIRRLLIRSWQIELGNLQSSEELIKIGDHNFDMSLYGK